MIVCPDCRSALASLGESCGKCGWSPQCHDAFFGFLGTADLKSSKLAEYIDTYDALAERNMHVPVETDSYVRNLAERFCEKLGTIKGRDFCDVGSGRGYLIGCALSRAPSSVTAIDIAEPSLRKVVETHDVRALLANAENLPFEREFDVLTATDILEHVLNMGNFLVTANWALRDGGVLGVRVPYFEDLLLYSNFHGLPMHFTHLRTFDRPVLVKLIESAGFEVREVHYDGFNVNYPQQYLRRFSRLRRLLMRFISSRFSSDEQVILINPIIGRLFMKPIEIGVVARKIKHIETVNAHESLAKFYAERGARLRREAF